MSNGAHPYVDSVTINGNQLTLSVEVTEFVGKGGGVEISGQVTQSGGALATFYQITPIPVLTQVPPDGYFVNVTAKAIPLNPFEKDQDVTIFVRTSRAWSDVLGKSTTQGAQLGDKYPGVEAAWDQNKKTSHVNGDTSDAQPTAGQ